MLDKSFRMGLEFIGKTTLVDDVSAKKSRLSDWAGLHYRTTVFFICLSGFVCLFVCNSLIREDRANNSRNREMGRCLNVSVICL